MATKNNINNKTGPLTITDSADITKEVTFNVSGVTTATTRTWTVDDRSIDFDAVPTSITTDSGTCTPAAGAFSLVAAGTASTAGSGSSITISESSTGGTESAFLATLNTNALNVIGTGVGYTLGSTIALTEIYDIGGDFNTNGTFTAPGTAKYHFIVAVSVFDMVASQDIQLVIVTSNRQIDLTTRRGVTSQYSETVCCCLDMDQGDTCTCYVSVTGEASARVDVSGNPAYTYFCGYNVTDLVIV